jgi:hypothetical protein
LGKYIKNYIIRKDGLMRKIFLLTVVIAIVMSPNLHADVETEGENPLPLEEKAYGVDFHQVETGLSQEPKLAANYAADLKDLQAQILSKNSVYESLNNELHSNDITQERKKELKTLLVSIESKAKSSATSLLELRYTKDKTKIRPEIIEKAKKAKKNKKKDQVSILSNETPDDIPPMSSASWFQYPYDKTITAGNFGYTTDNGTYSHSSYNNVLDSFSANGNEAVHSGWLFNPVIDYPDEEFTVDFKFRNVYADADLACGTQKLSLADVSMNLYNVTSNSFINEYDWVAQSCYDFPVQQTIDEGPTMLYMNNFTVANNSYYYIFLEAYTASSDPLATADLTVKWQYLQALID